MMSDTNNDDETIKSAENKTDKDVQSPEPEDTAKAKPERDATRYGDWEMNGRCIDF